MAKAGDNLFFFFGVRRKDYTFSSPCSVVSSSELSLIVPAAEDWSFQAVGFSSNPFFLEPNLPQSLLRWFVSLVSRCLNSHCVSAIAFPQHPFTVTDWLESTSRKNKTMNAEEL